MTTNGWLLLGAAGLAVAAVVYWRRTAPDKPMRERLPRDVGSILPPPPPADSSYINAVLGIAGLNSGAPELSCHCGPGQIESMGKGVCKCIDDPNAVVIQ